MKRKLFILLSVFLISLVSSELVFALNHSGSITQNEIWAEAENPHIITGLTTVSGNATLTIEPGVEVRFSPEAINSRLIIGSSTSQGRLIAIGTETQKITFTSNSTSPQPGDWKNIYFYSTAADDSIIENAIIEYGGSSTQGSLYISESNPTIRNCTVRYSSVSGISLYLSTAVISNCIIEENALYGVECDGFSGVLDGNLFVSNGSYPIYLYIRQSPNPVVNVPNTFVSNNPNQIYFATSVLDDYTLIYFGIPYFIPGLMTVSNKATLTIEPGVEVRFNPNATNPRMVIDDGRLIAIGTETQKIIFTSNSPNPQPGDWNNILIRPTTVGDSVIENAIIEYGGYPSQGSIYIFESNLTIRNCTVRYSSDSGISLYVSSAVISNCTIEENALYGVDCDGFSGVLDDNLFDNNGSYPISIYSRLSPNPVVNIPNTFVSNNPDKVYFRSNVSRDFRLINFGIPYLFLGNITVGDNVTLTIDPGVEVNFNTGCSLIIDGRLIARGTDTEKIIFTSNFINPQPGDWRSINFGSTAADDSVIENAIIEYGGASTTGNIRISGSNPTIRNCTVRYSSNYGIYLSSSSPVINCSNIYQNQAGIYATGSDPVISQNNISSNIDWGIYNSSALINAKYNWWGDLSGPSGEGAGLGDAVSENVAYQPWFLAKIDCSYCMGDFEPDNDVDGKNLAELVSHYGCLSNCGAFDLTGDGIVNGDDVGALALYYGRNNCVQ